MVQRRHFTEITLNLRSRNTLILSPADLSTIDLQGEEILQVAESCNIYIVTKRPRLYFVPSSLQSENGVLAGRLHYVQDGKPNEAKFEITKAPPDIREISYAEYPYRRVTLRWADTNSTIPAHLIPSLSSNFSPDFLRNLQVMYVGMSYGDGSRSAKDRLKSHSTLQKILADLAVDDPDCEVLLVLVEYEDPWAIIHMDGSDKTVDPKLDRDPIGDIARHIGIASKKIDIALAEAALIHYFRPPYNEKYKNRFPHRDQSINNTLYDADFVGLLVEINTEDLGHRLFSTAREPGRHHIAAYDLHDPAVRKSMFDSLNISAKSLSGAYDWFVT